MRWKLRNSAFMDAVSPGRAKLMIQQWQKLITSSVLENGRQKTATVMCRLSQAPCLTIAQCSLPATHSSSNVKDSDLNPFGLVCLASQTLSRKLGPSLCGQMIESGLFISSWQELHEHWSDGVDKNLTCWNSKWNHSEIRSGSGSSTPYKWGIVAAQTR